ncbi:MAG: hypothetical protein ACRYHQ_28610 [Janthinobacterium lividum]
MLHRRHALLGAASLLAAPALIGHVAAQGANAMAAAGKRAWASTVPTLRIGLLGGENDSDRLGRYDAYGKLL